MRYAILSDIHGNLEALQAVLDALASERIDSYLFAGDIVGYGADPKECIKLLRSLEPLTAVAGNHEWGALGKTDIEYFSEPARSAIIWTKSALGPDEIDYLKGLELIREDEKITLVHGTLNMPEEFYYIFDTEDAYVTLNQMKSLLCFVGHSHIPGIFVSDHQTKVEYIERMDVKLDSDRKYLINVGSVGQPRDGDPRACFAVYDDEDLVVDIKRVEYDVKKSQNKILKAGLPSKLAERLSEGR